MNWFSVGGCTSFGPDSYREGGANGQFLIELNDPAVDGERCVIKGQLPTAYCLLSIASLFIVSLLTAGERLTVNGA